VVFLDPGLDIGRRSIKFAVIFYLETGRGGQWFQLGVYYNFVLREFYFMADNQNDTEQDIEKTHWHIFSLQKLSPGNFVKILGRVLKNELRLIK